MEFFVSDSMVSVVSSDGKVVEYNADVPCISDMVVSASDDEIVE
jgi:hypothetical protein